MDLSALNRSPIGAAARAVGRVTFGAITTLGSFTGMVFSGRGQGGYSVLLGRTKIDYGAEIGDPTNNSAVASVVGWLSRNFPEAPVQVTREVEGQLERLPASGTGPGAMLRLLDRPSRYFSGALMWMAVAADLLATGNAYIVKRRRRDGGFLNDRVEELWWVPKRTLQPGWPRDGSVFISHYEYRIDGRLYGIEERDVIHLRFGIDPLNPRMGLSKLASLFREIYTDDEAANFTAVLLHNLGVPGVILAPSNTGQISGKIDAEAVKTTFMEKFGGDKRGEPMVMTAPTDIKVLSWSPEQMNLRKLRQLPEERISAVFGVGAMVAGLGAGLEHSSFTNYREAHQAAYEDSIMPLQGLIAKELKVQLLPDFASEQQIETMGLDVSFDLRFVRALQEDVNAVWKRSESAATKGLFTRASFLRAVGEKVATDGSDDVYVKPNNYDFVPAGGNQPPRRRLALPGGGGNGASAELLGGHPTPLLTMASEVRCTGCNRLLAEQAAPPYRFTCPRCHVVTKSEAAAVA